MTPSQEIGLLGIFKQATEGDYEDDMLDELSNFDDERTSQMAHAWEMRRGLSEFSAKSAYVEVVNRIRIPHK